jgi:Cft2 family RNA processing exonuclease
VGEGNGELIYIIMVKSENNFTGNPYYCDTALKSLKETLDKIRNFDYSHKPEIKIFDSSSGYLYNTVKFEWWDNHWKLA